MDDKMLEIMQELMKGEKDYRFIVYYCEHEVSVSKMVEGVEDGGRIVDEGNDVVVENMVTENEHSRSTERG